MAKKGDTARAAVTDTIVNAFSATGNFVTIADKKIYVTADDGGEMLQFAISITMPKVPVAATANVGASTPSAVSIVNGTNVGATPVQPIELSEDDKAAVARLMEELGITD